MNDFMTKIAEINAAVNSFAWGGFALMLLLGTGLVCTVSTGFFQIIRLPHWWGRTAGRLFDKRIHTKRNKDDSSYSQFQALCTSLAAIIGTGNIAGVSAAICIGGPGAVFWMWIAAFLGMMTHFSENVLAIYYRRKNQNNEWSGGPMYYLKVGLGEHNGLKSIGRLLAFLFAIFTILASFGIGNMSQINKITINVESAFFSGIRVPELLSVSIVNWGIGIVLMILAGLIVLGGRERIAVFAERVVPTMAILYIVGCLIVIADHADIIGPVFSSIFRFSFAPRAALGGVSGSVLKSILDGPIKNGCKRGVFSNEAGLGSSSMIHSNADVLEPVTQGMWGMLEVFFDTIVICTMTALVVLSSGVIDLNTGICADNVNDATLVATSFKNVFGRAGEWFVAVIILFFAFTTVVGWVQYGTKAFEYLFGWKSVKIYRVFFVFIVILGAVMEPSLAWDISDTFNGLMMLPNLIGVLAMTPLVIRITRNYIDRRIKGKDINPILSYDPYTEEEYAPFVRDERLNKGA